MAMEFDEILYEEARDNMRDLYGDDEFGLEMMLADMKDSGAFDVPVEDQFVEWDEEGYG